MQCTSKKTQKEKTKDNLSYTSLKNLKKVTDQINSIKDITSKILGLHSLYLDQTLPLKDLDAIQKASETNYTNIAPRLDQENIERNARTASVGFARSTCYGFPRRKKFKFQSPYPDRTEKPIQNLDYINEKYRHKLYQAFGKFNPITHLDNLYLLQSFDPKIER